ncbi:MAG: hypothetical protein ABL883_01145 [Terricaulis sp.]
MAQVVIVHALEDTLPARALAEKLRRAELVVELEKLAGEETRGALETAVLAIALWSPKSVGQAGLIEDVAYAREKGRVLHAVMQNAAAPSQFHQDRGVNLTGWRGEEDFPAWRQLAKFVAEAAGVAPPPPPEPQPDSGFFTPGRVAAAAGAPNPVRGRDAASPRAADPERAEVPKRGSGLMLAALAIAALGGAGGGYYFWNQSRAPEETASPLDELDPNDVESLRALINGGSGELAERAQQALNDLEERSFEAASDADIAELEAFLSGFPQSQHAAAARKRLAELQRATAAQQQPEPQSEPASGEVENAAQEGEPVLGEPPSHDDVQQDPDPVAPQPPPTTTTP